MSCVTQQSIYTVYDHAGHRIQQCLRNQNDTLSCATEQSIYSMLSENSVLRHSTICLCNQDVTLSCVTEQPFYVTRMLCQQ
jgi:hypothetical protein